jgi:hypothetical protein
MYLSAYGTAFFEASRLCRKFDHPPSGRLRYAIKAANLAVCFLGFAIRNERRIAHRSVDLGVMASLFDLASDGLRFCPRAITKLNYLATETLGREQASLLLDLMERKRARALLFDGLERGIVSLRLILNHLDAAEAWSNNDVVRAGIYLQIVDDVLDYRHDVADNELNFLQSSNASYWLQEFLQWDYEAQFHTSPHPAALLGIIKKARHTAVRLAREASPACSIRITSDDIAKR